MGTGTTVVQHDHSHDPKLCRRCNRTNDWRNYMRLHPAQCRIEAPFAFDNYCSAVCQALDMRTQLIANGQYNPITGRLQS